MIARGQLRTVCCANKRIDFDRNKLGPGATSPLERSTKIFKFQPTCIYTDWKCLFGVRCCSFSHTFRLFLRAKSARPVIIPVPRSYYSFRCGVLLYSMFMASPLNADCYLLLFVIVIIRRTSLSLRHFFCFFLYFCFTVLVAFTSTCAKFLLLHKDRIRNWRRCFT